MDSLLSTINTQIKYLRKVCGGFGKKTLKEKLTTSENMLLELKSKKKSNPDYFVLLDPFFHAVELKEIKYYMAAINCYTAIFKSKPDKGYIDKQLIKRILKSLFGIDQFNADENRIKAASCVLSCISSPSGKYFIHADFLYLCIQYLLRILDKSDSSETHQTISKIITDIFEYAKSTYGKPPVPCPASTVERLTFLMSETLCTHTIFISRFCPESPNASIADVDLICLIRGFCSLIGKFSKPESTLLCVNCLLKILNSDIPFLNQEYFLRELRTTIHVALLSLCLDSNKSLAKPTAEIILVIWRKFADYYNEGLNELLDQGLATALVSPSNSMKIRSYMILRQLVEHPQFMIDEYVNYDCDKSGIFHNIFENTVNIVVKRAYPEQSSVELQKEALKTLIAVLANLWEYYRSLANMPNEKVETVAESVLNQKKEKNMIEQAQEVFKKNPNKALQYFSSHGMCEDNAQAFADFIFDTPWLDPVGVGEIIGGSKPLNLEILPLFVKHFDFKGMSFEKAFRSFLSKFQIPGESQMIDRIMQQFGTQYYNDNPNMFSCADTVYVLSYSALMLHTDAHHPTIKNHMTLEEFIRNNRGIDNGADLPRAFLEELYRGITTTKINLSTGNLTSIPLNSITLLSQKQQAELFKERSKHALEVARQRTTTELHQNRFHRAKSQLLVGPMFESVWGGILGALTMSFEMTDDNEIIKQCLKGFQFCTHIASHCYIEDALQTLVDSFSKFTRLRTYSTKLKQKNFQCTQALLRCALEDRDYLKGAWSIILAECSALDKMSTNKVYITDLSIFNQLINYTISLDRESIIDFVQALCDVTAQALVEKPPRYSMLHSLENVAVLNMDRPMIIWREIWQIISSLFVKFGGLEDNNEVVKNVLSVFQTLSSPFIQRPETPKMHHKGLFLQPYIDIFHISNTLEIKIYIIDIIVYLIQKFGDNLQSGWEVVMQVIIATASSQQLILRGIDILQEVVTKNLCYIKEYKPELLLTAVCAFASQEKKGRIALQAVGLFPLIAAGLSQIDTEIWISLFISLASSQASSIQEVRNATESSTISIILRHGFAHKEVETPTRRRLKSSGSFRLSRANSEEVITNENSQIEDGTHESNEQNAAKEIPTQETAVEHDNSQPNNSSTPEANENNETPENDENVENNENTNNNENAGDNETQETPEPNEATDNTDNNETQETPENNESTEKNENTDNNETQETNENNETSDHNEPPVNENVANEENNANSNAAIQINANTEETEEYEADFNHDVWIYILTTFLPKNLFSFVEGCDLPHLVGLLKEIYTSIFEKFANSLKEYSKEILDFLVHCSKDNENLDMKHKSLECIESFVINNSEQFNKEELSSELIDLFTTLSVNLFNSVLFVKVLSKCIDVFSGDEEQSVNADLANKLIDILGQVSDYCSKERTKNVLAAWCTARDEYFRCIVAQNREEEVVEKLHESLEFYQSLRHEGTCFEGWDKLIAHKIKLVANMAPELFAKCMNRSIEAICDLVEVESEIVRIELVPLLKKQMEIGTK